MVLQLLLDKVLDLMAVPMESGFRQSLPVRSKKALPFQRTKMFREVTEPKKQD
jgi:hypothetical protein